MSDQVVRLFAHIEGAGQPVILLHGLFGRGLNLKGLSRVLAAGFEVHSLDLRNHGHSPHSNLLSYPLMAADVIAYMDQLNIKQCGIVGHSMGGKVAMALALQNPERVQSLLVADISPVAYGANHEQIFAGLMAVDFKHIMRRRDVDEVLQQHIKDTAVRQFLLANLYRDVQGHYNWYMNVVALKDNYSAIAAGLQVEGVFNGETLFIKGELSDYILPSHRETILSLFPKATLKTLNNTGHWLHAEKPRAFNRLCINFLINN